MKVKRIKTNEIVEAKRFKDLTEDEVNASTTMPEGWNGNEIFIGPTEDEGDEWEYVFDKEVEIIEE